MDARDFKFKANLNKSRVTKKSRVDEIESGVIELADLSADSALTIDDLMDAVCELAELIGGDEE